MTAPIACCLNFISLCCEEITASPAIPPDFIAGIELKIDLFIKKDVKKNHLMNVLTFPLDSLL